jgi:hypothetical protein
MARLSSDHDWLQSCGSGKSELDVVAAPSEAGSSAAGEAAAAAAAAAHHWLAAEQP